MTKFLLVYYGGHQFKTKEEGMAHMGKWQAWMKGLGEAVIDPGMPVGPSKTVSADGVSDSTAALSGITIVQAETLDQALDMAAKCPHVDMGGTIDVAAAMDMGM